MSGRGTWVAAATLLLLTGCGGAQASTPALTPNPQSVLLSIDQLDDAGFTVQTAAHGVSLDTLSDGDRSRAAALQRDGLQAAASVRYLRNADFATADGPLDVTATVERFALATGAATAFAADIPRDDAAAGAVAVSTGPLGDAAHADIITRATAVGLNAVQITVEWRVANLVNVLVLRGREGGTTIDDAIILARAQSDNELATSTPLP